MKKFLIVALLALFVTTAATAQDKGVQFTSGSFKSLLTKAKEANRYLFMDLYTTWCGPCKYMSGTVFPQPSVGRYFNETFINAKFDAERGEGIALKSKYKVTAYPTFLIIDSTGKEVGRIVGSADADEFVNSVRKVVAGIQ